MTNHTIRVRKTKPTQILEKTERQATGKDFFLFLSIPTAVILIVAAIVQGPSLFARPSYDFIYSMCNDYGCGGSYKINSNGRITYSADNTDINTTQPTLYYYSEAKHSSRQIPLQQASGYTLDTSNISPDGYILWQDTGASSGLFEGNGSYDWYLKNGAKRKLVNLASDSWGNGMQLIGWVR